MKLLQSQKNKLFDILEEEDLSPSSFEIYEDISQTGVTPILRHKTQEYSISFQNTGTPDTYVLKYIPGEDSFNQEKWVTGWQQVTPIVRGWAQAVGLELTEPDKWKRLEEEVKQIRISESKEGDKFNALEYDELTI